MCVDAELVPYGEGAKGLGKILDSLTIRLGQFGVQPIPGPNHIQFGQLPHFFGCPLQRGLLALKAAATHGRNVARASSAERPKRPRKQSRLALYVKQL